MSVSLAPLVILGILTGTRILSAVMSLPISMISSKNFIKSHTNTARPWTRAPRFSSLFLARLATGVDKSRSKLDDPL